MQWKFELLMKPPAVPLTEGPVWDGEHLYFTHIRASRIMRAMDFSNNSFGNPHFSIACGNTAFCACAHKRCELKIRKKFRVYWHSSIGNRH